MKTWIVSAALLVPAAAAADNPDCDDAAATLVRGKQIVVYCESCGDKAPGIPFVATGTETIDAVHSYVRTTPERFDNVALLTRCAGAITPPSLRVESETPNGVLITPGDEAVRPATAEALVVAVPAPEPPPPPPAIYYSTIIYSVPWLAVAAIAGTGGFLLGLFATMVLLGTRRRHAMTPRAADLVAGKPA